MNYFFFKIHPSCSCKYMSRHTSFFWSFILWHTHKTYQLPFSLLGDMLAAESLLMELQENLRQRRSGWGTSKKHPVQSGAQNRSMHVGCIMGTATCRESKWILLMPCKLLESMVLSPRQDIITEDTSTQKSLLIFKMCFVCPWKQKGMRYMILKGKSQKKPLFFVQW